MDPINHPRNPPMMDIAAAAAETSIGGFEKINDNQYSKKISTPDGKTYTMTVSFHANESEAAKKSILEGYGNAETSQKMIDVAKRLGLGQAKDKAAANNQPAKKYTVTAMQFQFGDGGQMTVRKTRTKADGQTEVRQPKNYADPNTPKYGDKRALLGELQNIFNSVNNPQQPPQLLPQNQQQPSQLQQPQQPQPQPQPPQPQQPQQRQQSEQGQQAQQPIQQRPVQQPVQQQLQNPPNQQIQPNQQTQQTQQIIKGVLNHIGNKVEFKDNSYKFKEDGKVITENTKALAKLIKELDDKFPNLKNLKLEMLQEEVRTFKAALIVANKIFSNTKTTDNENNNMYRAIEELLCVDASSLS